MLRKLAIASLIYVCSVYGAETLALGSYGVSAVGSAQYNVPIWTPPGIGQIQPNLALIYDSNLGPGMEFGRALGHFSLQAHLCAGWRERCGNVNGGGSLLSRWQSFASNEQRNTIHIRRAEHHLPD